MADSVEVPMVAETGARRRSRGGAHGVAATALPLAGGGIALTALPVGPGGRRRRGGMESESDEDKGGRRRTKKGKGKGGKSAGRRRTKKGKGKTAGRRKSSYSLF